MKVLTKIEVEGLHRCVFSLDVEQSPHVAAVMVGKCVMMPVNINNLHEKKTPLRHSILQNIIFSHVYSIVLVLWAENDSADE